jgi:hypothetical protein
MVMRISQRFFMRIGSRLSRWRLLKFRELLLRWIIKGLGEGPGEVVLEGLEIEDLARECVAKAEDLEDRFLPIKFI